MAETDPLDKIEDASDATRNAAAGTTNEAKIGERLDALEARATQLDLDKAPKSALADILTEIRALRPAAESPEAASGTTLPPAAVETAPVAEHVAEQAPTRSHRLFRRRGGTS